MDRQAAIDQIKDACTQLSRDMMKINPAITHLKDEETQGKLYEAVYKLTADIETVKKLVIKLQGRDGSTEL